ncbi:S-adenosylmethionine decarboxylase proenzyme-like [Gigantopelta aegis]|uniref:S-adenosylmethionine decarboxylase proenzyme-like n=1 Tax=Gigantopelta aegis TaxID=1735272 RepID=UPI001B88A40E|nr:S-adenosylmethionine decarboxylase proenzyme-like [Gigantopelta aegis]
MMAASENDFFEGTEKLLEVWFASSTNEDCDLRTIDRLEWEKLLTLVKCEIISCISDDDMDAYVLSESSMFVTQKRFILKTCGRTTLLSAISPLVKLVREKCGFDKVVDIFYSRKNFSRPELQFGIHRTFENEVRHLDELFPNGAAYTLGRVNRDCWYLYTLDQEGVLMPDQTFEILMWDMCPDRMNIFSRDVCTNGPEATKLSGICDIMPGAKIDDFLFDPHGYSMNGLLPGGYYITIHVTPEPQCSYVSFESNVPTESYQDLLKKVLDVFRPGKFLMTVFANEESVARESHRQLERENTFLKKEYVCQDHQYCNFKNYNLTYMYFSRPII